MSSCFHRKSYTKFGCFTTISTVFFSQSEFDQYHLPLTVHIKWATCLSTCLWYNRRHWLLFMFEDILYITVALSSGYFRSFMMKYELLYGSSVTLHLFIAVVCWSYVLTAVSSQFWKLSISYNSCCHELWQQLKRWLKVLRDIVQWLMIAADQAKDSW